jgi:ER protein Pkr1
MLLTQREKIRSCEPQRDDRDRRSALHLCPCSSTVRLGVLPSPRSSGYSTVLVMVGSEPPGKDANTSTDTVTAPVHSTLSDKDDDDFLSNILAPGSSLNPTFLLVVDGVLALLALTLVSLVIATGGNVHLIALLVIELALWVSIKWWGNQKKSPVAFANK